MLTYVCSLSRSNFAPDSLPEHVSSVAFFHEVHSLHSTTCKPFVRYLLQTVTCCFDQSAASVRFRIGCSAIVINALLQTVISCTEGYDFSFCTNVVLLFIFKVRAVSNTHHHRKNVNLVAIVTTFSFFRRKDQSLCRPFFLHNPPSPIFAPSNPINPLDKWVPTGTRARFLICLCPPYLKERWFSTTSNLQKVASTLLLARATVVSTEFSSYRLERSKSSEL